MNPGSIQDHIAGSGSGGHPLPPGDLTVPVREDALSPALGSRWVEPFYLADPAHLDAAARMAWCRAARACDDAVLDALLAHVNWRPRRVGAWFIALRGAAAYEERLGRLLLRSDVCFSGRGYAVALASLATPQAVAWLERYLQHYLALPDCDYDQAEAFAALAHLDPLRAEAQRPAWSAFVAARSRDRLPSATAHVQAQLAALATMRARVLDPDDALADPPRPAPSPSLTPPVTPRESLGYRWRRLLAAVQRLLRGR